MTTPQPSPSALAELIALLSADGHNFHRVPWYEEKGYSYTFTQEQRDTLLAALRADASGDGIRGDVKLFVVPALRRYFEAKKNLAERHDLKGELQNDMIHADRMLEDALHVMNEHLASQPSAGAEHGDVKSDTWCEPCQSAEPCGRDICPNRALASARI